MRQRSVSLMTKLITLSAFCIWSSLTIEGRMAKSSIVLTSRSTLLKPQFIAFQAAPTSRRSSAVRFCSGSAEPLEKMEKGEEQQKPPATTGNIMWDSFGHEYATRSDEEGFGGIYGTNQSLRKDVDDQHNNPVISAEQNDSQGRETKQEEAEKHAAD